DVVIAVRRDQAREPPESEDQTEHSKSNDRELLAPKPAQGDAPRTHSTRRLFVHARTRNAPRSTSKTASVTSPRSSPSACRGSGRSQRAAMRSSSCSEATSAGGRLPVTT